MEWGESFFKVVSRYLAAGVQLIVFTALRKQLFVRSAFNDAAFLKHDDAVAVAHCGQTMRDNKGRATFHQRVHTLLHKFLGARVNAACGFVKNEHRRIGNGSTGNGQQLSFTLAQVTAVGVEDGVVAVTQTADEAVGIDEFCSLNTFLVARFKTSKAYVVNHGASK